MPRTPAMTVGYALYFEYPDLAYIAPSEAAVRTFIIRAIGQYIKDCKPEPIEVAELRTVVGTVLAWEGGKCNLWTYDVRPATFLPEEV